MCDDRSLQPAHPILIDECTGVSPQVVVAEPHLQNSRPSTESVVAFVTQWHFAIATHGIRRPSALLARLHVLRATNNTINAIGQTASERQAPDTHCCPPHSKP